MISFLSVAAGLVNDVPTAEDIEAAAEMAKLFFDTFTQQSAELRIQYEFSGKFLTQDDKENLQKLAKRAITDLETIAKKQETLKQQIEDYKGDDWDQRYGVTGLWRKLSTDIYITNLSKCEIDFYLALTAKQPQRNDTLYNILAEMDSLHPAPPRGGVDLSRLPATSKLLKARTFALLARTEPTYKPLAKKEFDELMIRSDTRQSTAFRTAIERIKLLGLTDPDQLKTMAENIAKSRCNDDIELVLSLAFLQRRDDLEAFEKIVSRWPQTEDFLGSLILQDLSYRTAQEQLNKHPLQQTSIFEAELAALAAWKSNPREYKALLAHLLSAEKFQTPLILYVAAAAFAPTSPAKAVTLLVKASSLQQLQKSDKLDIEPDKIAEQAAQLAYNLFAEDSNSCPLALKAFENYSVITGDKIDEELEYLYTIILNDCGRPDKSKKLLEKIANRPAGKCRSNAGFGLIAKAMQQKQYKSPKQKNKLLRQFSNLITDSNDCEYAGEAMELLSETIDKIEHSQAEINDFGEMLQDCKKLAQFCYDCLDGQRKQCAGLYLTEVAVFAANGEKRKLLAVEKLLNNLAKDGDDTEADLLRCQARLAAKKSEFHKAAGLWAQICKIRKSEAPSSNKRCWKWWRAKFYELYCWAEMRQAKKQEILHTIEVLENSFTDIPPLWAEKLSSLKQQCRSRTTSPGK